MESYSEMLRNFKKVHFALKEAYPGYYVDFDYDPRQNFVGMEFTLWSSETDDLLDKFTKTTKELVVSVNKEICGMINLDEVEDYMVMYAVLSNQMDCILPKYSHKGWEVLEDGIKEKGVKGLSDWENLDKQIQRPSVKVMNYEDLMIL